MTYFRNFPRTLYKFGNELTNDLFQNIAIYADVVDQVRDQVTLYENYYIKPDERPDQVSFNLYNTSDYHWTFYLMNPELRESGWPISNEKAFELAKRRYNTTVLTTLNFIYDKFKVGQSISGSTSGGTGTIVHRDLQLGQIWIKETQTFINGEQITSTNSSGTVEQIILNSSTVQYNAIHHYENSDGEYVDIGIDPSTGNYLAAGGLVTPVTWLERLNKQNEDLKQIRVIKPSIIESVSQSFKEAVAQ